MFDRLIPIGRAAALLLLAATAACSDDGVVAPSDPAGSAVVRHDIRLTTPHEGDEAALLVVTGAPIDSVTTPNGAAVVIHGDGATRLILSGTLTSGVVANVWTRAGTGTPSVALEQVTEAGTHAQRELAGYRVQIAR